MIKDTLQGKKTKNKSGKGNIFSNVKVKQEMLEMRRQGHSYPSIAKKYGVHMTSIIYHCKRANLVGFIVKTRMVNPFLKVDQRGVEWLKDGDGQWLCVGKTRGRKRIDEIERKRRELEQKRLKMLTY